jgi:long-chain acyl-CoA synthetase
LAAFLIKNGLKPGEVVEMYMPNIQARYIGVVAAQKAGGVSTGLSPHLTLHEVEHQLKDSKAKVITTVDVLFEKVAEVAERAGFETVIVSEIADFLPGVKRVLGKALKKTPTGEVKPLPGNKVVRSLDAIKDMPVDPVLVKRDMDDIISLLYTGVPRAIQGGHAHPA